jgi:hypothetical protein
MKSAPYVHPATVPAYFVSRRTGKWTRSVGPDIAAAAGRTGLIRALAGARFRADNVRAEQQTAEVDPARLLRCPR